MEAVQVYEAHQIEPKEEVERGTRAANELVKIIKQVGLARKFGGEKEHLYYEAWQAVGKFFGTTVKTGEAIPTTVEGVPGAKASAVVLDEQGTVIGGAEAYCLRDEGNWKNKPFFQLASMAQTRAGAKALRNKYAWVVSLAGFAGTPAEEMESIGDRVASSTPKKPDKPAETEQTAEIREALARELDKYCEIEEGVLNDEMYHNVLKEITVYTGKDNKEHFFKGKEDIAKAPIWAVEKALKKLRERTGVSNAPSN